MRSKTGIKNELVEIKRELKALRIRDTKIKHVMETSTKTEKVDQSLLGILQYIIEQDKATRRLIENIYRKLEEFEAGPALDDLPAPRQEQRPQTTLQETAIQPAREVTVSGVDGKILQFIQRQPHSMACSDDIKREMGYKGRNAASARLNKLYARGVLERYQLGHKVYYKFNAGKTTDRILIVSPPQ